MLQVSFRTSQSKDSKYLAFLSEKYVKVLKLKNPTEISWNMLHPHLMLLQRFYVSRWIAVMAPTSMLVMVAYFMDAICAIYHFNIIPSAWINSLPHSLQNGNLIKLLSNLLLSYLFLSR